MTVWKLELSINSLQTFSMPKDSEILQVREKDGIGCMWFRFPPKNENYRERRTFVTVGTGWDKSDDIGKYVGTYFLQNGVLVFHVFEKEKPNEND